MYLQKRAAAATCVERHIGPLKRRLNTRHERIAARDRDPGNRDRRELEAVMEHASSHSSFNTLFMVSFFASFVMVMLHFG